MLTVNKIRFKNFMSYGAAWNEVDISKDQLVAINGVNGGGKCLDRNTKLTIKYDKTISDADNEMIVTLDDVYELLHTHREYAGHVYVETRFGFYPINACEITAHNSQVIEIELINGDTLKASPDHLLYHSSKRWVKVKDLIVWDYLLTKDGWQQISKITKLEQRQDLLDIEVEDKHEFYANGFVSHNSSILSALSFALYNRAFNGAPKSKLINSINGKQMVVEVEFVSNAVSYKVVRGSKPTVFQIFKDGKMINEDSNSRDYQSVLEDQILRMNYKTFIQTVIVGTASYTPFMELSSNERRVVVEDLLGVGILTTMASVLKQKAQTNTSSLNDNAYQLKTIKIQLESDKAVIDTLKQARQNNIDNLQKQKKALYDQIEQHNQKIDSFNKSIEKMLPVINKYDQFKDTLSKIQQQHNQVVGLINNVIDQQQFITNNKHCPTCHQKIDDKYRNEIVERTQTQKAQYQQKLDSIQAKLDSLYAKQQKFIDVINKSNQLNGEIRLQNNSIRLLNNQIGEIDRQIDQPDNSEQIDDKRSEIEQKVLQAKDLIETKITLVNEKNVIDQCGNLLKDTGIKSAVVSQYLPIINQMINKYLADMDFFLNFELDAQFNETIRARGRDDMTYQNLSQGERRRLD